MRFTKETVLGILFLAGLAGLAIATIVLTEFSFRGRPRLVVYFPDGKYLKKGDAVHLAGVRWGRVKEVRYSPTAELERRVRVVAELERSLVLREGYEITILESTLLGGRILAIEPGPQGKPEVSPGTELRGAARRDPLTALSDMIEANEEDVRRFLAAAASAVERIDRGEGTIGKLVRDDSLFRDFAAAAREVRGAAEDARAGKGTIGKLLTDEALYADLRADASAVREILDRIARGEGSLGRLISQNDLHDRLTAFLEEGRGAAASVGRLATRAEAGEGTVGRLFRDPSLYDAWKQVGEDVRDVTTGLREGRGTLGQLLRDEGLLKDLRMALKSITRQIEDARESAPIATFAGLLFGVL
jgi:phospholipid/cholesterol/gamma-HCH transport system substrate-binding protein